MPYLHTANGGTVTLHDRSDHEVPMLKVASLKDEESVTALLSPNMIALRRETDEAHWKAIDVGKKVVRITSEQITTEIREDGSVWQGEDGNLRQLSSTP